MFFPNLSQFEPLASTAFLFGATPAPDSVLSLQTLHQTVGTKKEVSRKRKSQS